MRLRVRVGKGVRGDLCACVGGRHAGRVMEGMITPRGGGGDAGAWRDGAVTYRER